MWLGIAIGWYAFFRNVRNVEYQIFDLISFKRRQTCNKEEHIDVDRLKKERERDKNSDVSFWICFFGYCLTQNKLPCSNPRLHTSSVVDHWKTNNTFCRALFALKASGICDEDAISDCPGFQQLSVVEKSISSTVTTNFSLFPPMVFTVFSLQYTSFGRGDSIDKKRGGKKKRKKEKMENFLEQLSRVERMKNK